MNVTSLIALQRFKGIGRTKALKVASEVPSDPLEFKDYVELKFSRRAMETRLAWDRALRIIEQCEKLGIHPVAVTDDTCYPDRLHSIQGKKPKPPVLYIKGSIDALRHDSVVVAIVGTRNPTENGINAAYGFGKFAATNHIPVVSGLAYGCDVVSHRGCLEHGGIAIAVMAHGLDIVYPPEHLKLADQIIEQNGCLVSEYPPGTKSARWTFVDRDRIQSGLSDFVIVAQTGKHGGTHHTAKAAQEQGRKIFCVEPQESETDHPSVEGMYDIINNQGAEWITNPEDLLLKISGHDRISQGDNTEVRQLELEF
ncbi:MAG: DNA-protecting protein DprA [Bacteroidetes bacterium]|nr:DNA-protecting protein DprA [Bacteroidota bacterium]MDE2672362.1 DNA-protecting protein DprA [Bacteroidota bacterium]